MTDRQMFQWTCIALFVNVILIAIAVDSERWWFAGFLVGLLVFGLGVALSALGRWPTR